MAILIAIYLASRIIMMGMGTRGIADIHTISITTTNGKMDKSAIAAVIGIPANTPTYKIKLDDILTRVMTIPDIDGASVRRTANGNIKIRVNLRTVVAYWMDGERFYPLAADGAIINRPIDARPADAIVFRGTIPSELITITDALKNAPTITPYVDYLEWTGGRRWNIMMRNGMVVMLPEQNIMTALNTFGDMEARTNILNRDIRVLDLRDSERTFVKVN